MGIPQGIYLLLVGAEITWQFANHGKPKPYYNGWYAMIVHALIIGLLWWGGFFGR